MESITMTIIDTTAPVIQINDDDITIELGGTYTQPACSVTDLSASGIACQFSGSVHTDALGTYTITVNASDASGNDASAITYDVHVVDTTAPVIVVSTDDITVEMGDSYTHPVCSVTDLSDDTLPCVFGGSVDVNTVGTYTITVNATDDSDNVATSVSFDVHVVDTTAPVVSGVEDDTVYPRKTELKINFNEGTATLNGEAFANGTVLDRRGEYTLVVTDAANNVTTIQFEIEGFGFGVVLLIVFGFIALVAGGVFFYIKKSGILKTIVPTVE
jgi:hypothetical protein